MNVRLQYDLEFLGGIYFEDQLQLNSYRVNLSMITNTSDANSINIAMDRLKAFVYGELEHTVFINSTLKDKAELMHMMGMNMTTLPEEPVDQIVGMMLYYKLNAIMEDRIQVVQLDISSTLGDNVWFQHDEEDSSGPFFAADGWWHNPTVQHNSVETLDDHDNVVKVIPNAWVEYGLMWPNAAAAHTSNTVVFGNFSKNDN